VLELKGVAVALFWDVQDNKLRVLVHYAIVNEDMDQKQANVTLALGTLCVGYLSLAEAIMNTRPKLPIHYAKATKKVAGATLYARCMSNSEVTEVIP
jgi:hypothetical protein